MASYTNVPVALGDKKGTGKTPTLTYTATEINTAINNAGIPSDCTITKAIIKFMGAKSLSLPTGRSDITMTLGSYSKIHTDVIGNEGTNDEFSSYDDECTSDDIKGYIGSNGRFSNDLSFYMSKSSSSSTYWRSTATIYFDYTTHEHSYTTETSRTPSTCCTKGSVTKECSCGETQTTELALDSSNHSGGTEVKNASSATCTATGYTGDTYCKGCGAKLSSGSTIAALGHSYTSKVTPPTETASGYTTHTCSRCGHSYKDNYTALITVNCDTEMGAVEGGGTYNHGDTVSLFAMANEGYEFVRWSDGWDIDHRLITVTESATYTAIFEKILPPEITSVQMLYSNKQISAANKVPAGEFFRIVVGAVAYDS